MDVAIGVGAGGEVSHDVNQMPNPNPQLEGYLSSRFTSGEGRERALLTRDETYEGTDVP